MPDCWIKDRSIFVVAPLSPWPPKDGGRIGILYRIRELWRHGAKVTLFFSHLADEEVGPSPMDEWCEDIVAVLRPSALKTAWRRPWLPYPVVSRTLPKLAKAVREHAARKNPSVLHLEQSQMGLYHSVLPRSVPVVLGIHNLEHRELLQRATSMGASPSGIAYRFEGHRMRRYEMNLFRSRRFARYVFVSADEAASVTEQAPEIANRTDVLPPGCDIPALAPRSTSASTGLVFVGALWYDPNVEGLMWFLDMVWPLVRQRVRDARFVIAGRRPSQSLAERLRAIPGVEFLGEIDDVQEAYQRGNAIVLPVRFGAGVKVKTVEALAQGLPCIGTNFAFTGLTAECRRHAIVEDDPERFADACVKALQHDRAMAALGRESRAFAERKLAWSAIGDEYVRILADAARVAPTN